MPKRSKNCEVCGKKYEPRAYRFDESRFCSYECMGEHNKTAYKGENGPGYKGGKETYECRYCGEEFEEWPSQEGTEFCDQSCYGKWLSENGAGKKNPNFKGHVSIECKQCGLDFEVYPFRADEAEFCSRDCKGRWQSENLTGEDNPNWIAGLAPYGPGWNEAKREQVRERDGRQCQSCGMTGEEHRDRYDRRLAVHHIVPAREFDNPKQRNDPSNLIALCASCHAKWERLPGLRPATA